MKITLDSPGHLVANQSAAHRITITNLTARRTRGLAGLRFESTRKFDVKVVPETIHFSLAPHDKVTFDMQVDLSRVEPYLYSAKVLALVDFDLYYVNRLLFVKGD